MLDVAILINKSNSKKKKLNNKLHFEFLRCNRISKAVCALKGKCQYQCIVYKVEVNNDNNNYEKKVYADSTQEAFKKYTIYFNHRSRF